MSKPPEISKIRRLKRFVYSYSGCAAIIGCLSLVWTILYKCIFVNIPAPYAWMIDLGDLFYPIALSIVASCVFYFITIYGPFCSRRKKEETWIREWIQQLVAYGEWLKEDICGKKDCSWDEFEMACNKNLMSPVDRRVCIREGVALKNWFDYFENHSYWIDIYMSQVIKYGNSIPPEVLIEFEKYNQFDNLKIAVEQYKRNYAKGPMYRNMKGFAKLIWMRAESLSKLDELYVNNAKL